MNSENGRERIKWHKGQLYYGRPSPPKIQGCQIDQQIQRWCKDQLQDSIANKGMAWPNYRQSINPGGWVCKPPPHLKNFQHFSGKTLRIQATAESILGQFYISLMLTH